MAATAEEEGASKRTGGQRALGKGASVSLTDSNYTCSAVGVVQRMLEMETELCTPQQVSPFKYLLSLECGVLSAFTSSPPPLPHSGVLREFCFN